MAQLLKMSEEYNFTIKNHAQNYDWTFSTPYQGTIVGGQVEPTTERINITKLQAPEPIIFYEEMTLFEDELADNGSAVCELKLRVMPTCLFCLLRFFLRVDGVLFRLYDTRYFMEFHKRYFIREWTHKELDYTSVLEKLGEDNIANVRNPAYISDLLELKATKLEKVSIQ
eukprot:TRINITY_DN964_c0_g1_i6.p1 TRINITY_DN964_c0_g1~~TRINITY_DN964_c0_g1_i6.p1  ORF type:complete len:170 (+),score=30.36 TRINITY_DN964_c0_g1_i6:485-994(+)